MPGLLSIRADICKCLIVIKKPCMCTKGSNPSVAFLNVVFDTHTLCISDTFNFFQTSPTCGNWFERTIALSIDIDRMIPWHTKLNLINALSQSFKSM